MLPTTILSALAMVFFVSGSPVELSRRFNIVNHDSLNPIPTRVEGGVIGRAMKIFTPLMHIAHGCQPYTAADDNGNISGGLQDTGSSEGACRDQNKGQIYTRGAWFNGRFGIMYAYYFPKDAPISGNVAGGHRHDWENIVVWIDNPANANPKILGAAASAHGKYETSANPPRVGNSVKVEYYTTFPLDHAFQFTETVGRSYFLSDWNAMGATEQDALTQASFGAANVPFKNDNFMRNLGLAWV